MNMFDPGQSLLSLSGNVLLQVTAILIAAWLLTATVARSNAAARHGIWLIVLLYLPLSPLVACAIDSSTILRFPLAILAAADPDDNVSTVATSPAAADGAKLSNRSATSGRSDALQNAPVVMRSNEPSTDRVSPFEDRPAEFNEETIVSRAANDEPTDNRLTDSAVPFTRPSGPVVAGRWFVGVWLAGMFAGLIRLAIGLFRTASLRRSLVELDDPAWRDGLRLACDTVGLKRAPGLAVSPRLTVPVALGPGRPMIALPAGLADSLSREQAGDLLIHECVHLRRRDHWVGILQRVVAVMFWPHPLVHLMNRRLDQTREDVCDNVVLQWRRPTHYATTLLQISERCGVFRRELGAVAMLQRRETLEKRVTRILDRQRNGATRVRLGMTLGFALAIIGVGGLASAMRVVRQEPDTGMTETSGEHNTKNDARRGAIRRDSNGDPLPDGAIARLGRLHLRPGNSVMAVAWSPDGRLIASATHDGLQLWDAKRGLLIHDLKGHNRWVKSVAFSPDGKRLVSGGADWTVRIWNVDTGEQVHLLRAHRFGQLGRVHGVRVAFSSRGTVIGGGLNGVVQVWDAKTGKELRKFQPAAGPAGGFLVDDKRHISALALSADGNLVAAASYDHTIRLWDIKANELKKTIPVKSLWVRDLRFAPDGKTLAWCGTSRSSKTPSEGIVLWDLKAGKIQRRLPGHKAGRTYGISFSPDGKRLASSGFGNTVKLWNLQRRGDKDATVWTATGHTGTPWAVAFSPDGTSVVSGAGDGSLRIWNTANGKEKLPNPMGHWDRALGVSMTPDGRSVLLGTRDGRIRFLSLKTGRQRRVFAVDAVRMDAMAFSQNGKIAAVGSRGTIQTWNVTTGKRRWSSDRFNNRGADYQFKSPEAVHLSFSKNGRLLVSTTADRDDNGRAKTVVRVWNALNGRMLAQLNRPFRVSTVPVFAQDDKTFTLTEYKSDAGKSLTQPALRTFDAITGGLIRKEVSGEVFATGSALSPDGRLRAVGTSRSRVRFLDAKSGKLSFALQGPRTGANFSSLAFSRDGKRLAAASRYTARVIFVWEIATGELTHEFDHPAESVRFTADGKRLLTSHRNGTMLVWDLTAPYPKEKPVLTGAQIARRWEQLAFIGDSSRGNQGSDARSDALIAGGEPVVAFIEKQLLDPNLPMRDTALARRLASGLESRNAATRASSRREVLKFGDPAYLALRNTGPGPAAPGTLKHVEAVLLERLGYRRNISLGVLRQISTLRARRALTRIADAPVTPENRNRKLIAGRQLEELKKLKLRQPEE